MLFVISFKWTLFRVSSKFFFFFSFYFGGNFLFFFFNTKKWGEVGFSLSESRTRSAGKWLSRSGGPGCSRKLMRSRCFVMLRLLWLCSPPKESFLSIPLMPGFTSTLFLHFFFSSFVAVFMFAMYNILEVIFFLFRKLFFHFFNLFCQLGMTIFVVIIHCYCVIWLAYIYIYIYIYIYYTEII
jgi:hypothetical protein